MYCYRSDKYGVVSEAGAGFREDEEKERGWGVERRRCAWGVGGWEGVDVCVYVIVGTD